jgi:hypothetical protein
MLPLAIIASLLGMAIVIPTAVMVGTAALRQGDFEDKTRESYLAESAILAVIADLQRGADGDPLAPLDYIPPTVNFADAVPVVSVRSLESELETASAASGGSVLPSKTVATSRIVTYEVGAPPTVSTGAVGLGGVEELADDDGVFFRSTAPSGATTFSYEVTSETVGFSRVDFGEVRLKIRAWEESVNLEVFLFNDDLTLNPSAPFNPWVPVAANLLDHHHAYDETLDEKCGGVTRIVLEYTGAGPAGIEVLLKKISLGTFSGVATGGQIEVLATDATTGKLHPEITLEVDGAEAAKIHTSCSRPIAVGDVHGEFVIRELATLPGKGSHKHNDDHERPPHTHDDDHFHGKYAKDHSHKDHHVRNSDDEHDAHDDAHDLHHDHHDDADHDEDDGHGHHGHKGHDHHHDKGKNTDHHHYQDAFGNDDHLQVHNHPSDHGHHGHKHKKHDHDHGQETVSFFLSEQDLAYLNLPTTTTIKLKVRATTWVDPEHHHQVKKHDELDEDGKKIKGDEHDHVHHWNLLDRPPFGLETDRILFELGGAATTDERQMRGEPVITRGTVLSGSGRDLRRDDDSFLNLRSEPVSQAYLEDKKSFKHVVEFEVTSDDFAFSRMDTLSVPFVFRSNKHKKAKLRMFVFNPTDPNHNPDGYSTTPDLVKTIKVNLTDRATGLSVPKEDVAYLNALPAKSLKVKIRVSLNTEFEFAPDWISFIATTTDVQEELVRQGSQQFIDPGLRDPAMAVMPYKTGYLLRIQTIQPGIMNINWGFEPHVHNPDGCSGVTRIVLKYTGTGPVDIEVSLKKDLLQTFLGVNNGDLLEIVATDETKGKLHSEISLTVDGVEGPKIHTSCSKPIAIDDVHGDFVIDDLDVISGHKNHKHHHHHDNKRDISIEVYRGLVIDDHHKGHKHEDDIEDEHVVAPGRITSEKGFRKEDNTLVARSHVHAHNEASFVSTGYFEVDSGLYTIVFFNDDKTHDKHEQKFTVVSKPFAEPGPGPEAASAIQASTGYFASVYKDYVIRVKAGKVSQKAVVRQIPGPSGSALGP